MKLLRYLSASLVVGFSLFVGSVIVWPYQAVYAVSPGDEACAAIDCNTPSGDITDIAITIFKLLSWVAGLVAVIMIIWAGMSYILSAGDSNKVSKAKNALIYAIIGVIIVALSQAMVHFVAGKAKTVTGSGTTTTKTKPKP